MAIAGKGLAVHGHSHVPGQHYHLACCHFTFSTYFHDYMDLGRDSHSDGNAAVYIGIQPPWHKALLYAFIINAVSTAAGFLIPGHYAGRL